jgi:hypothetical protein
MGMDMQCGYEHAAWIWTMDMHGCRNTEIPIKSSAGIVSFPLRLGPASAFRHHGQSGTATHGLVR